MKEQEQVESRLRELEAELKQSKRETARLLEFIERQQDQLNSQGSIVARLDYTMNELLSGRTWRTLRATGNLLKKLAPARLSGNGSNSIALSRKRSYLVCDEPKQADKRPRSGNVAVRGWCLCEGGVDLVQVEVPGLQRVEVVPSVPRPDVRKAHPDLDRTGKAG